MADQPPRSAHAIQIGDRNIAPEDAVIRGVEFAHASIETVREDQVVENARDHKVDMRGVDRIERATKDHVRALHDDPVEQLSTRRALTEIVGLLAERTETGIRRAVRVQSRRGGELIRSAASR